MSLKRNSCWTSVVVDLMIVVEVILFFVLYKVVGARCAWLYCAVYSTYRAVILSYSLFATVKSGEGNVALALFRNFFIALSAVSFALAFFV